jgi:hypothetical protein
MVSQSVKSVFLKTSSTVEELYQRSLLLTKISYTHATYRIAISLLIYQFDQNFFCEFHSSKRIYKFFFLFFFFDFFDVAVCHDSISQAVAGRMLVNQLKVLLIVAALVEVVEIAVTTRVASYHKIHPKEQQIEVCLPNLWVDSCEQYYLFL